MMNNVTLIGYLGADAQSHTTRNKSTLTILSLATKHIWKRQTGEVKRRPRGTNASRSTERLDTPPAYQRGACPNRRRDSESLMRR